MSTRLRAGTLPLALILAAASAPAHAEPLPLVYGGSIDTKIQAEATRASGNPNDPGGATDFSPGTKGNVFADSDIQAYANWSDWLSFNTDIKLERQRNDNLNDYYLTSNTAFRSEGLIMRQLYATVRPVEGVAVYGGKIHPKFGSAWGDTPGLFYNFGSDYEQDEKIGFGLELKLPETLGKAALTAETFYTDTSFLSNSIGARPATDDTTADRAKRIRAFGGGQANTGKFNNYTVALRGKAPPGLDGLKYQLSYTHEEVRLPNERPEDGGSASASYKIDLTHKIDMTPFVEYTRFTNTGGRNGLTRAYTLGGLAFNYGKWELDLAGGQRNSRGQLDGTQDDRAFQENVSLQYEIMDHLKLGVGYNHVRISDLPSNTFAVSTSYGYDF